MPSKLKRPGFNLHISTGVGNDDMLSPQPSSSSPTTEEGPGFGSSSNSNTTTTTTGQGHKRTKSKSKMSARAKGLTITTVHSEPIRDTSGGSGSAGGLVTINSFDDDGSGDVKRSYSLSNSGTFKQGELTINQQGIMMGGETPVTRHKRSSSVDVNELEGGGFSSGSSDLLTTPTEEGRPSSSSSVRSTSSSTSESSQAAAAKREEELRLMSEMTLDDIEQGPVVGRGAGGMVKKATHIPTGRQFALKIIALDVGEEQIRKQIMNELKTLWNSDCNEIIEFYHAFYSEGNIHIALEYMDGGSLLDMLKLAGKIPEHILSAMTRKVLTGLFHLHKSRHTIHRDLKPSNVLLNSNGDVKLADFGVSGQLASTLCKAQSFVGTATYMSPERIRAKEYSYDADIWSLGLMTIELATGRFPYPPEGEKIASFFDLLDYIVEKPEPSLSVDDGYSDDLVDFVQQCLQKEREQRASSAELLAHPFITKYEEGGDETLRTWVIDCIEEKQRKEAQKLDELRSGLGSRIKGLRKAKR